MADIMRWFDTSHLTGNVAAFSHQFTVFAETLDAMLPEGPEKSTALRKLLEAKDAGVRAFIDSTERVE